MAVVDLQLTAPSGLEPAKAIRAAYTQARIVFVSSMTGREYLKEVTKAGACGVVGYEEAQADLVPLVRGAVPSTPATS